MKWIEYEVSGTVRIPLEERPVVDRDMQCEALLDHAADYLQDRWLDAIRAPVADCEANLFVTDFRVLED